MIRFEDMTDMKQSRPGEKIKTMLLYFPDVREYRIWNNYSTADGKFVFKTEGIKRYCYASLWIELEGKTEIPF